MVHAPSAKAIRVNRDGVSTPNTTTQNEFQIRAAADVHENPVNLLERVEVRGGRVQLEQGDDGDENGQVGQEKQDQRAEVSGLQELVKMKVPMSIWMKMEVMISDSKLEVQELKLSVQHAEEAHRPTRLLSKRNASI